MMTRERFDAIYLGEPVLTVQSKIGPPYSVHRINAVSEEYEYIERMDMGKETVLEYHYFLVVKEGKVEAKRIVEQMPPAYDLLYRENPNHLGN